MLNWMATLGKALHDPNDRNLGQVPILLGGFEVEARAGSLMPHSGWDARPPDG